MLSRLHQGWFGLQFEETKSETETEHRVQNEVSILDRTIFVVENSKEILREIQKEDKFELRITKLMRIIFCRRRESNPRPPDKVKNGNG